MSWKPPIRAIRAPNCAAGSPPCRPTWLDADQRGCALANAAIELPEKDHPARKVIEQFKAAQRDRLIALCGATGIVEPELLADELFLLLEGARVSAQSFGPNGPASRLVRMGEALIASHLTPA